MKCWHCGKELKDGLITCDRCGAVQQEIPMDTEEEQEQKQKQRQRPEHTADTAEEFATAEETQDGDKRVVVTDEMLARVLKSRKELEAKKQREKEQEPGQQPGQDQESGPQQRGSQDKAGPGKVVSLKKEEAPAQQGSGNDNGNGSSNGNGGGSAAAEEENRARVAEAVREERNTPPRTWSESAILKVIGIVVAAGYGIAALKNLGILLIMLIQCLFSILFDSASANLITGAIDSALMLLLSFLAAETSLTIAFRRDPENSEGLLIFMGVTLALRTAVRLLLSVVRIAMFGGYMSEAFLEVLHMLAAAAVSLGAFVLISYLTGQPMPKLQRPMREHLEEMELVFLDVRDQMVDTFRQVQKIFRRIRRGF